MSEEPVVGGMQWEERGGRVWLGVEPDAVLPALARVWSRIARGLTELGPDDFERPTRCTEWRVVDVVNHLADANNAVRGTVAAAVRGELLHIFDGFDPRTVPKMLTDAASRDPQTAQARLTESVEHLLDTLDRVDLDSGLPLVETPLGPQPPAAGLLHLLWDAWLHERDVFLPLGQSVPELEDEVRMGALYCLRIIGLVDRMTGREAHLALRLHGGVEATLRLDADAARLVCAQVEDAPGEAQLSGDAATVVDALTGRGDLDAALSGPEELRATLTGLRGVLAPV